MSEQEIAAFKKSLNKFLLKSIKPNCAPLYNYLSVAFRNGKITYNIAKVIKIYIYPTDFKPVKPGNRKPKEFIDYNKISLFVEFPVVMFNDDPYTFIEKNAKLTVSFDGFDGVSGFLVPINVPSNVQYLVIKN
jgi:hypothetical protein